MAAPRPRDRIRELNDAFQTTFAGGRVMLTAGVNALPDETKREIIAKVRAYNTFTRANDPHSEHDFGAFEHGGRKFFWRIDAYDKSLEFGSPDPSNPAVTTRVLTIMHTEEY